MPFDGDPPCINLEFATSEQSQQPFAADTALALAGFLSRNVSATLHLRARTRFVQPASWRALADALGGRLIIEL